MAHAASTQPRRRALLAPFDRLFPRRRSPHRGSRRRSARSSGRRRQVPGGALLPATSPTPYYLRDYDPVWAAIRDAGMLVVASTCDRRREGERPRALTLKVVMENASRSTSPMTEGRGQTH